MEEALPAARPEDLKSSVQSGPLVADPFRLMVDTVVDYALFMLDVQGFITSWNRGAEHIKGYRGDEVIGKHFSLFYPPESLVGGLPAHELAMAAKLGRYEDEGWRIRKDGSRLWANVVITALRDEDGELVGFFKVTRDLSERRKAEQVLASAYERLNTVLECTSDSVVKINGEWILVYANRRAADAVPNFFIGKNYWDCFPTVRGTSLEQILLAAMRDHTEASYELLFEPHQKWYRGSVYPSDDGLTIFFADITAQKTLEEQIERERLLREKRVEALSHMAGGLAHEINNPLAIIYGRASDLLHLTTAAESLPSADVKKACESIVKTSERAMRILKGLKGFGREAGKDPIDTASVYEIVDQCVELQGARFDRHKVELRLNLRSDLPYIECRETQIVQIVTNLLNNAFDAIVQGKSEERWVELAVNCAADQLHFDVLDSGPGIDDKAKSHLMEPFFTTKELGLGMGIGLSLSRAIAQDHGGTLILIDNSPHTCFRLTLPVQAGSDHQTHDTK